MNFKRIIRRVPYMPSGTIIEFLKVFFGPNWSNGNDITQFENEFRSYLNVDYAVCTSYGLHAMTIALKYYDLRDNHHILIPGYTAKVVQKCLDELQIKYRLVDIDPSRGTMCPIDLEKKITSETKAVLVTHLLGNACDEIVFEIARKNDLIIIEDCAHAHGARLNDKNLGSLGSAAFFSFGYSKLINTFTGGMLVTNDKNLYQFAKDSLRNLPPPRRLSLIRKLIMSTTGSLMGQPFLCWLLTPVLKSEKILRIIKDSLNFFTRRKMTIFHQYSNVQATLGRKQLANLDNFLAHKKSQAEFIINNSPKNIEFLEKNLDDVYFYLILKAKNAEALRKKLFQRGIDSGYGNNIMDALSGSEDLEGVQKAISSYLMLPNYLSLSNKQLEHISKTLKEIDY